VLGFLWEGKAPCCVLALLNVPSLHSAVALFGAFAGFCANVETAIDLRFDYWCVSEVGHARKGSRWDFCHHGVGHCRIAGSLLATFVLRAVGHYDETQSAGWIASFVGAFILLLIYRLVKRKPP